MSVEFWTDGNGFFYVGDMRVGDRAATPEEIATWESNRIKEPTIEEKLASVGLTVDELKTLLGLK